jgi:hypothetical protein
MEEDLGLDGCLGFEPRVARSRWLAASAHGKGGGYLIRGMWVCPCFNYTLAFSLQLRKITEGFVNVSGKVLGTVQSVDLAYFLRAASTGLLISVAFD